MHASYYLEEAKYKMLVVRAFNPPLKSVFDINKTFLRLVHFPDHKAE
jgi:hypothetical protein